MDRFDDVESKIVEAPEPAPRRRRRGVAVIAAVLVAGGLAAGASALASPDEPTAAPSAKPNVFRTFDGDRSLRRGHHGCSAARAITAAAARRTPPWLLPSGRAAKLYGCAQRALPAHSPSRREHLTVAAGPEPIVQPSPKETPCHVPGPRPHP